VNFGTTGPTRKNGLYFLGKEMNPTSGRCIRRAALVLLAAPGLVWAGEHNTIDHGVTAWMLTSTTLVLLMVPGLALFYGGLVRTKNVVGTMMHSFAAMAIIAVLWVVCGYSMAFGKNALGGWIGWDSNLLFLRGLDETIMPTHVPEYVFAMFQGKFAIITPALIAGAFAERVNFKAYCIFIVVWGLLIYNPICHWVWASDGFLARMGPKGVIDFAGGIVVHISAGVSALVACLLLGSRRGYPTVSMRPSNLTMTLLGAGLLWVGWFGFNAGSSVDSGILTAQALTATQASAASGALAWMLIEAIHQGKATALGFGSGMLAGLVAITPAAGVMQPGPALLLGVVATVVCYLAILAKNRLGYDDSLDAFGVHGMGSMTGLMVLSFFIRDSWMADAVRLRPGWDAWHQFGIQAVGIGLALAYSALGTLIIVVLIDKIFGFRAKPEAEMAGLDHAYHGERGYGLLNAG
jgi:ammonium transporter, Amt family